MKKLLFITGIALLFSCKKDIELQKEQPLQPNAMARTFSSPAQNLLNKYEALGLLPDANRQLLIASTIDTLISRGVWDKLDFLFVWVSHNKTAALIDWKNPQHSATIINDYANSFTTDNGFKGNGSNFRINLNWKPSNGVNYTQDSCSLGVYLGQHVNEGKTELSSLNSNSGTETNVLITTFSSTCRANNTTSRSAGSTYTNRGLVSVKRVNGALYEIQRNGYDVYGLLAKPTDISEPLSNQDLYEFCRNNSGAYSNYSNKRHYYSFAGAGSLDHDLLNKIMEENYLDKLNLVPRKRINIFGNSFIARGIITKTLITNLGTYDNYEYYSMGLNGKGTPFVQSYFQSNFTDKQKTFLAKDIFFLCELTNDFYTQKSNVTTTYNNLVAWCQSVRTAYPNAIIVVPTMLPRAENASMVNAKRQNDANLYDGTTLNGRIRNELVQNGYADYICDWASDPIMGIYSNGVAGVGEQNTTYYDADKLHPNNTTGFPYLTNNYVYPLINGILQ